MGELGFFSYKGKPLVRKGNIIYYGYMQDDVVAMLTVEQSHDYMDLKISDRILLQLISTNPNTNPNDIVVKYTVKYGLYEALDIAGIWIDRYSKKANI